jgi:hypothetical protein
MNHWHSTEFVVRERIHDIRTAVDREHLLDRARPRPTRRIRLSLPQLLRRLLAAPPRPSPQEG